MPRPKYRAPPQKEHKEKLEAFSFADAWRRKSFQSQHSPMGTRAPSRRNSSRRQSWYGMGKKSFSGKSEHAKSSRGNSISSNAETEKGSIRQREHVGHAAVPTRLSTEVEQEGDDDVGNGEYQHASGMRVSLQQARFHADSIDSGHIESTVKGSQLQSTTQGPRTSEWTTRKHREGFEHRA